MLRSPVWIFKGIFNLPLRFRGEWKLEYGFKQIYQTNGNVGSLEQGFKSIAKNPSSLKKYKQFFSVNSLSAIFLDLTYPAIVCDLKTPNYSEYQRCAEEY